MITLRGRRTRRLRRLSRRDLLRGFAGTVALAGFGCEFRERLSSALPVAGAPRFDRLQRGFDGRLILPGDSDFDAVRRVASFNPRTDHHPAAIVRCAGVDDVARAVTFARDYGLTLAVRSGGHDVLGSSTVTGGLLVDLADLSAIEVDVERARATVGPGVRAGELDAALAEHGLVTALGCNPAVGVAGLTLGGGLGWLLGRFGASCDNLVAIELVTADGKAVVASERQRPDLFWALRGGGGNFGVVTRLEYRLHELGDVTGGYLVYSGDRLASFLRFYRDLMSAASDDLVVEVVSFHADSPVVVAVACHAGDAGRAERELEPLRRFGPPRVDGIRRKPFASLLEQPPEVASLFAGGEPEPDQSDALEGERLVTPGYNHWRGGSLAAVTDDAIEIMVETARSAPGGWSLGVGHYIHGAICRVDPAATALVRRSGSCSYYFNVGWGDPADSDERMAWVDESMARLAPHASEVSYINYLSSDSTESVRAAYGDNYSRLQDIKARYDPDNHFRLNRNIRPGDTA